MQLTFSCPSELISILPPPLPARVQHPVWYDRMPEDAYSEMGDEDVKTVRCDVGFSASFDEGVMLRLACSVHVDRPGELRWDWGPPAMGLRNLPRSPIHMLDSAFVAGTPFYHRDRALLTFSSFWAVELPEGWSLLMCHPLNRFDTPFQILSRIVKGKVGEPQQPLEVYGVWQDEFFTGVLPRGMPFVQCFLVPDGSVGLHTEALEEKKVDELNSYRRVTSPYSKVMRPLRRSR